MAEAHDRCENPRCTLGRGHTGAHVGAPTPGLDAWAAGPYLAARPLEPSPLAAEAASVDQLLIDLHAMASEADESARHYQRRAADLRAMAREIRAWLDKSPPAPTGVASTGRGQTT